MNDLSANTVVVCSKCGARHGTEIWAEGTFAYAHGNYTLWCRRCVLDEQIARTEKMVEQLPILRLERAALESQS